MKLERLKFLANERPKLTLMTIGLSFVLLISSISGCGEVISNSERYYQEHPRGRINWREYLTD